ncbi:GntR family transcriptional regulator [Microbacterium tumbae]
MTGESRSIGKTKQLLAEEVFRHLGTAIVNGELGPRERIRDAEIALQLHVSRMPIREALQRLERIGLVTMYPSRYTEVTEVTDAVVADSREFAALQSGFVARLACARMTDAEHAEIDRLIDEIVDGVDDLKGASLARQRLFDRLSELSGNALQHALMTEASLALARNLQGLPHDDDDRDRALSLYAELREAMRSRDAEAVERISRAIHGGV